MKKNYFLIIASLIIASMVESCKNEATDPTVTYEVTTENENSDIFYLDGNGEYIHETITSNYWTTSFIGKEGDSVSISIKANTVNDKIAAKIIYDGKIIQDVVTYGQSSGDTVSADISTKLPY